MTEQLDDRTYDLLFGIRRSVRYHNHRRRFYEIWNSITVAAAMLGGSSVVATFLADLAEGWSWLPVCLAAAVAVLGTVDLAVGTLRCAYLHGDLARRFISLEQRFAHGRSLEDDEHEELTRARLGIEADEPPPLRLLDVMCHFELLRSLGDKTVHPDIPWPRRKLAYWMSQADYAQRVAEERMAPAQSL